MPRRRRCAFTIAAMATEHDDARPDDADHDEDVDREPGEPPRGGRRRRPHIPPKFLAFAGVLAAGVLIGWVVFREDESPPDSGATTVAGQLVAADERVYPRLGIKLDLPKGWETSFRQSVLTAVSSDETVSVAIAAAAGGGKGPQVRRSDRNELAKLFKAHELSRNRARIGTATTIVTELLGQSRNGRPIRILSMGASSRWRTYSIQSFTVLRPTARRLAELRTLMTSVRYRQPE